ncbi:MAG: 5-formyltetrahydrofolate cyclo-ligase [Clostridiales Family XIII bacterium]|jgi:5-formyltetrahydrofolate cyclo-ligase|nr:5-formyltetrahydrofolate cyclo-ligase [Clostridiales Family XIII bacterium]
MADHTEKNALRAAYKQSRMDFVSADAGACARIDLEITERLLRSDAYRSAKTIFTYVSVGAETDTRGLIARAFADGKSVCVPRTSGRGDAAHMDAVPLTREQFRAMTETDCGAFGIPEPPAAYPALARELPDLIIAPSLAVDVHGYRLGYGGGYYDRYIEGARKAGKGRGRGASSACILIIAIQRSAFVTKEALPREPHDQRADAILTENGVIFSSSFPA